MKKIYLSLFLFLGYSVLGFSQDKKEKNTITITTENDGESKTITYDFEKLAKSLEEFGESMEKFGDGIEEFFDDLDDSKFEVIEVDHNDGAEMEITISESNGDNKEKKTVLRGKEAEDYLEAKRKEGDEDNWLNLDGNISIDVENEDDGENVHVEINLEDLFDDFSIEFSEDKKKKKKIIIIKHTDEDNKEY